MNALKWVGLIPGSYIVTMIFMYVFLKIAALITFDVTLLEGLAIYGIFGAAPSLACLVGMSIAPRKQPFVKWITLISQAILAFIFYLPGFILTLTSEGQPPLERIEGFDSLSAKWQLICLYAGTFMGLVWAGVRPISEYIDT